MLGRHHDLVEWLKCHEQEKYMSINC